MSANLWLGASFIGAITYWIEDCSNVYVVTYCSPTSHSDPLSQSDAFDWSALVLFTRNSLFYFFCSYRATQDNIIRLVCHRVDNAILSLVQFMGVVFAFGISNRFFYDCIFTDSYILLGVLRIWTKVFVGCISQYFSDKVANVKWSHRCQKSRNKVNNMILFRPTLSLFTRYDGAI